MNLFEDDAIFRDEQAQTYRVIQVNLAGSNLDRCGIVYSISHPLAAEAHINLLYLSTFKSANVLVKFYLRVCVCCSRQTLTHNF